MIVFICAIFAISILYLYFDINAVVSSYAVTDLAILVFFINVGIRIRFPYAIFTSATCLLLGSTFLYADSTLNNPEKFESLAILLSAVFLSIVGNYSIERVERLNFLLLLRSDTESETLADANDRLFALAREDRLTGIPNRGHFEEAYKRIWKDSVAAACPLSIIMVDVDNFKILNDTYGHLYGDEVLRRAATLLKECMRKEGDFVARYGGEDFVVVLPNSSEAIGLRVAERIRLLIEVAGSPAVEQKSSSNHGWTTVSCGVATTLPRNGIEPSTLIASADNALYAAKSEGRNRVSVASDQS
jgi:diguanylate cyclase (GGDEF)-like protein